jgi:hypothetical protein
VKHRFTVIHEQDCTPAEAVGAFLDCEHYIYLHNQLITRMDVLRVEGRAVTYRQYLKFLWLRTTQEMTLEYFPPGHFSTYNIKPSPWWVPSIHHLIKVTVDVDYSAHPERDTTMMRFDCQLDMPFWLWPTRKLLQRALERMHWQKDQEDLEAIWRRQKLFGRGNIAHLIAPHQFLLHKDDYIAHFGHQSVAVGRASPASAVAASD